MNLLQLVEPLITAKVIGDIDIEIDGIKVDSRQVEKGDLFLCLSGFQVDGHDYAKQAVENGAVAIVCEKELPIEIPQIIVKDSRFAMALIADIYYDHPSHRLKVIGVTGTNGKTTTTHLIEKILDDHGHLAGLIGTIKMKIGNEVFDVKNTTPDALELQKSFAKMLDVGSDYAIMEVSSHALDIGRVRGVQYHIAVFTNLTQDHLDFHETMEKYREAKGLLFSQMGNTYDSNVKKNKYAVLNADDRASEYYKRITAAQVITYGIDKEADVRATKIVISSHGTSFILESFRGTIEINLKMIGKFSVYNALAATAVALIEGISLEKIKRSLEAIPGVDGRFESVNLGQDFTVLVDYAHTPDSLENVLKTIKEFVKGKIYCVFGAGGDRDRTKRPLMGEIAMKYSDFAVVTSDNPRTEDPQKIINDILVGIERVSKENSKYIAILDRKQAIEYAINNAQANDVVLIAGKGHETYQILKDEVIHFDDREVAKEAIRGRIS
ncbi:UDP-N-acetylmuramoyl-L-alanyl-D-glutamate--2,6-diaminopimelate ligase [Vulcanibacillus modesticaldus]|uniref:UDP-N-acetylmuramoyl-L-alanyl-D-glutamate--2,6-diaminopimelate ligase n=1 Tax=Vulcanibacillus modesticaldus TaxID=337097 RepID=A0A1D2YUY1_9BACI|nr:UDP-N-acetylmuramoyl-L-alanyl-D-glutamate--2,6-diaminopimelate ligase [Vulcanibacillus modesticaldus]OEF99522.1 UDP-N-acetylmuramoyl-L-alanyl-D-glutamate--2,6-diaminopimelate ligase [Vulcanibacillus modesticaldus]